MRNKLRRQDAVVFPVKANGTKNMASIYFFPPFLTWIQTFLAMVKQLLFRGDHRGIVTMTLSLPSSVGELSPVQSVFFVNINIGEDLV